MKKIFFLVVLLCTSIFEISAQTYQIGHTTLTFIDVSRSNRSIATEIYYPADISGDNVPMTTINSIQFPSLVFGHGFVMTWDAYQNFWNALVPNGYIIAFPKTEGSLSPSHLEYAKDLAFVINQINFLGTQNTSLFYNRVSSMNAVLGHSMGGGASFLAVPLNSNIKTLVSFAPAETTPSAITASSSIGIPTLIFAGANDCVTPPISNQIPMYNGLMSVCKTLITIVGGSHCQMANSNVFCNFGEASCTPAPTITRTTQHTIVFNYLLKWLDFQLKSNCVQGDSFDSQIISDAAISYQKNCIQCDLLQNDEFVNQMSEIIVYPNPAKETISFKGISKKDYAIVIYDLNSKVVKEQKFNENCSIDISKLTSGIYSYKVTDSNNIINKGKFIKK